MWQILKNMMKCAFFTVQVLWVILVLAPKLQERGLEFLAQFCSRFDMAGPGVEFFLTALGVVGVVGGALIVIILLFVVFFRILQILGSIAGSK